MKNTGKIFLGLLLSLMVISCSQQPTANTNKATQTAETDTLQIKDEAQNQVFDQYLKLKNALVASNASESQQAAQALAAAIKNTSGLDLASKMTDSIATTTDLAAQRATFTNLSNQLIAVFKKAELTKGSFYVQFCPMANEGNGGYWLAAEQEVRNPYYGDEMLNCGEVKDTIK